MKIGNKIRKIREFKNISSQDMADRMNMSLQGYGRVERDEVSINMERLLEISGIFDMKPEEVMSFDEKNVFNNHGDIKGIGQNVIGSFYNFPEDLKRLYEENARLQEEKNKLQADMIALLQEKIRGLEGK
jgi:transcriptional regulator with XRE-family HTH domain